MGRQYSPSCDVTECCVLSRKVQVGNDQEKAQSERNSHQKTEVGKTKLTIKNFNYLENISLTELVAISQ